MVARADHELISCPRCGIARRINSARNTIHCHDCYYLLRLLGDKTEPIEEPGQWVRHGMVWRWETEVIHNQTVPSDERHNMERMTPTDLAWAERQAERHFWDSWRRANRQDINPLQAEAERRTAPTQRRKGVAA